VPITTLASALGAASRCGELVNLNVLLDDDALTAIDVARLEPDCRGSLSFTAVEPGEHALSVSAERAGAAVSASCSVEVLPGLLARPSCEAD
jgi:hypothetical protein